MGPTSNSNQYFGVKVSQVGTPVNQASDTQLVYKSNFSTNLFNGPHGVWKVMEGVRAPTVGNGLTAPQQGFWVAEDGVDVQQATDAQMVFNSNNTVVAGSYTITSSDESNAYAVFNIPHNLGFEPSIQSASFWSNTDGLSRPLPWMALAAANDFGNTIGAALEIYSVDNVNIVMQLSIYTIFGLSFFATNSILNFKFLCSTLAATGN